MQRMIFLFAHMVEKMIDFENFIMTLNQVGLEGLYFQSQNRQTCLKLILDIILK